MTPEQQALVHQAHDSLQAAWLLHGSGYHGFAASRAYYTMFYLAEALLLGKGLAFSKHSGVHSAFGKHFVKTGLFPEEFHQYLIRGMEVRHAGDYSSPATVTPEESAEQIRRAEEFIEFARRFLDPGDAPTAGSAS